MDFSNRDRAHSFIFNQSFSLSIWSALSDIRFDHQRPIFNLYYLVSSNTHKMFMFGRILSVCLLLLHLSSRNAGLCDKTDEIDIAAARAQQITYQNRKSHKNKIK